MVFRPFHRKVIELITSPDPKTYPHHLQVIAASFTAAFAHGLAHPEN
jgi:hypothetical protein